MTLPVIPLTYRCSIQWATAIGVDAVNVMHFVDADETGDPDALAALLDSEVQTHQFEGFLTSTVANTVDIIALDGVAPTESYPLTNWAGESGSGDIVPQASPIISLRTAVRGPKGRGRLFMPGVLESIMTNGRIDAANTAEIQAAWSDFVDAMATALWPMGVASYKYSEINLVTNVTVPRVPGIVKRRVG